MSFRFISLNISTLNTNKKLNKRKSFLYRQVLFSLLIAIKALIENYPNTTSKVIIRAKPMEKPMVERLECSPSDASGMSSSTTT